MCWRKAPPTTGCRTSVFILSIVLVIGAVLFFWRAFRAEEPIVDLRAFSNVNFSFGSLFSFVLGIGLYGLTYLYPLFLGRVRGYDSLMIGEALFVSGLAMFLTAPVAGFLSRKMDLRIMMMIGFLGFAAGTWRMTYLTADWDFHELLGAAGPARRVADAVHGADQQRRAGHPAARPAEERVGPVQPDAQPRRRGGARRHQHRAHRPQRLPLRAAGRACALGQRRNGAEACRHGAQLRGERARRHAQPRCPSSAQWSTSRHG